LAYAKQEIDWVWGIAEYWKEQTEKARQELQELKECALEAEHGHVHYAALISGQLGDGP
jgi:hypothetical protein